MKLYDYLCILGAMYSGFTHLLIDHNYAAALPWFLVALALFNIEYLKRLL
jgi:hypothetical protein